MARKRKSVEGLPAVELDRLEKNRMNDHKRWKAKEPEPCEHCDSVVKNMCEHVRRMHPEIHAQRPNKLRTDHGWPKGYSVISKRVRDHAREDKKRGLLQKFDRALVAKVMDWIKDQLGPRLERSMKNLPCFDDVGCYMPYGFWLGTHSLFAVSLDRKDKAEPHFDLDDQGQLVCNVRLTMSGINNRTNVTDVPDLPVLIREKLNEKHTQEQVDRLLEEGKVRNVLKSILYNSACGAWRRDKKTREHFKSSGDFFDYCYNLAEEQRMVWGDEHGGILMSDTLATPKDKRYFAPSLSAIDPRKGHVPGNLEWIPMCFNNTCCDKDKVVDDSDDPHRQVTQWTIKLVRQCFGNHWNRRIDESISIAKHGSLH
jgi:hypothetical protein